ncbi:MAG: hypothetical protein ACYS5V_01480 [Planctomycetota bacterium]|jgi:hypothetical protein
MTLQPLIHRDSKGSVETFEPGSTLDMNGRIIGLTPTTRYHIDVTNGSDASDGLSWGNAVASITQAFTLAIAAVAADSGLLRGRFQFFVAPGGYEEDLVTPLNTQLPFGQLIAWNPTTQSFGGAYLYAATAATFSLIVRARGWRIQGFEIGAVANGGCIWLDGATANSNAAGCEIIDNIISGWGAAATVGIDVTGNGAPLTQVRRNHFNGMVGAAIECSASPTDQPRFWLIEDNVFVDNGSHIDMNPRGFKESWIRNNCFMQVGANRTATVQLDNRGGSACAIGPGNFLSDTYDNAGGYFAGADEDWYGNASEDGYTTANPA